MNESSWFEISLVPTSGCHENGSRKSSTKEMSLDLAVESIEAHKKSGGTHLRIIPNPVMKETGCGDPAEWTFINEVIFYGKKIGLFVTVETSGIVPLGVFPDKTIVEIQNFFLPKFRTELLKNLTLYRKKTSMVFRHEVRVSDSQKKEVEIGNLAKKNGVEILIVPMIEKGRREGLGKKLFDFACLMEYYGVEARFENPVALCLFTNFQKAYLRKNFGLNESRRGKKEAVIGPDGKAISEQSVTVLNVKTGLAGILKEKMKKIFREEKKMPKKVNFLCRKCPHFWNYDCEYGQTIEKNRK